MSDDETVGLILGLLTLCCCCGGLLAATGAGLFFFIRRRSSSAGVSAVTVVTPHSDPAPPDAVRQALLALNRSSTPKPYVVRLDGDKVVCEWNTGHTLEITLDESTHTAHFSENEANDADSVKNDARQVIRSVGWNVQN